MKPKALRHITRLDDSRRSTHAWQVRVQRHNQSVSHAVAARTAASVKRPGQAAVLPA